MRNFLITIVCLFCVAGSFGQAPSNNYGKVEVVIIKEKRPKRIYAKVEIKSAFIGGDSSWVQSLEKRLNQSLKFKNGAKPGKYIVSVQFVVAKDSTIADVRCLNETGFGMGAEVVRAIRKGIRWTPAPAGVRVQEYRQ